MKKPHIGVSHSVKKNKIPYWATCLGIRLAGGIPVSITADNPQYETKFDGLIITGGTDIEPSRYHSPLKETYSYEPERDTMELKWLAQAEKQNIPVLGICRGAQLMNISRNGTLHVDVAKAYEKAQYPNSLLAKIFYRKRMYLKQPSLIYDIINRDSLKVNSLHTQAIDALGRDLKMVAKERNQVVQVIEDPNLTFYIGVQFHPELLLYSGYHLNIFKALVKACY